MTQLIATGAWQAVKAAAEDVGDPVTKIRLLESAAEGGDTEAMVVLVTTLGDDERSRSWEARLLDSADWPVIRQAAQGLRDREQALRWLTRAASDGDRMSMALLVGQRDDPKISQRWQDPLVQTKDASALRAAAAGLEDDDRKALLLEAAANEGDTEAMSLLVTSSQFDRDVRERWTARLIAEGTSAQIWHAATRLDESDPVRALTLHRAAADAGDTDSMSEVVVRCVATHPEASAENQARLAARGEIVLLRQAAERLAPDHPSRAAELEALVAELEAAASATPS